MTPNIQDLLTLENVRSTYTGTDGKCCCGCAGSHRYPSAYRAEAGKHRGYPVSDDEVSDRSVKSTVTRIKKAIADGVQPDLCDETIVSVVLGSRLLIAYLRGTK